MLTEKRPGLDETEQTNGDLQNPVQPMESAAGTATTDMDAAWDFLQAHQQTGSADIKRVRRKVDWRIMPLMMACYSMQFLDKITLNYAAIMGLNKDLRLKGNQFSNAATIFFVAFLIAEVSNSIVLQKVPAAKWLSICVIIWGAVCACTAAVRGYSSLMAARFFLGFFESAIAPCLTLITAQWYTKREQGPRFAIWYCGTGVAQILGSIISYGFQHVHNRSIANWRIMFIFLGLLTSTVGLATLILLPDSPMKARFLNEAEKMAVIRHVAENKTGIVNTSFVPRHLVELLTDPQIYILGVITILGAISSGVITTYSATLVRNFGYAPDTSALLLLPSGAVSILFILTAGFGLTKFYYRSFWLVFCFVPGIIGGALLSFLPKSRGAVLSGIYVANSIIPTLTVTYSWIAANIAGSTKRVVAATVISASFAIGNIIGPQTFQAKDAPQYIPAKIALLVTQAVAAVLTILLAGYYWYMNLQKERRAVAEEYVGEAEKSGFANLTDRKMDSFKYQL